MNKIRYALATAVTAVACLGVLTPAPAEAAGNFACYAGDHQIGGNTKFCVESFIHYVADGKVVVYRIDVWISGDPSQLEGGSSCTGTPAANYNLKIIGPNGQVKWDPPANCLTQAQDYNDTWTTSLDGVGPIGPNSRIIAPFVLRDNGGADSSGSLSFTVD